jgi:hypothetical protein
LLEDEVTVPDVVIVDVDIVPSLIVVVDTVMGGVDVETVVVIPVDVEEGKGVELVDGVDAADDPWLTVDDIVTTMLDVDAAVADSVMVDEVVVDSPTSDVFVMEEVVGLIDVVELST